MDLLGANTPNEVFRESFVHPKGVGTPRRSVIAAEDQTELARKSRIVYRLNRSEIH